MGTQGTGRKRSTKKERSTAEDDALNLIAREAEARLAAKRAARAEAREIRMKELERQQKEKYYGLNTKVDDRADSKWGDIEQWMEDSERYSRSSRIQTLSDDDERMSVGSRGSVRSDLDAAGTYSGASSLHKKSKKKKKHKHKDKDRNGYDDDYSVISSRSSRLSDDSRVSRGSRLDLQPASYASSDLYSLNGLSSSRNPGSAFNGYQSSLYEDGLCSGSRRVTGSSCHPLEYTSYRSSGSRVSSRAGSARASPVDNCGSVASFLRSAASSSGLPRDLDDVTIPDFSDVEDRDYLEKGSRAASALTAATLTSLGGTSSRRGSGETAIIVDAENSIREIKEIHELKDQIQDVEAKYTQNLKEVKDALAEVEEKYRKAMVSNAQLDNEKNNLMYQVDTLKDSLMELEELLSESRREYEEKVKEHEREKHAHSVLQFQFNEMKETLKQSEELLNEIRQLRIKQEGFVREISDLQETVEWKDKKIGALERQKEYTDAIRIERDELREEVVTLKDILKKHGIVLGPDLNINGEVGEADVDGSPSADAASQSAPDSQTLPTEGNSMLGNTEETELRSSREEEVDPEQQQEKLEEAKENHLSSDTLCNVADVSTLETSSKEEPSEEQQTCLPIEEDSVGDTSLSHDLNVDMNDCPTTETKDIVVCSPELPQVQPATCPEESAPETEISERVKLEETSYQDLETETKSSRFDTHSNDIRETCDTVTSATAVSNTEPQQEPENTEEAENDVAEETPSKSQSQGATASGKKKKKKKRAKKKGGSQDNKNQQKGGTEEENGKTEQVIEPAAINSGPTIKPVIHSSVEETINQSKMDDLQDEEDKHEAEEVDTVEQMVAEPTGRVSEQEDKPGKDPVSNELQGQTLETQTLEEMEGSASTENPCLIDSLSEVREDHDTDVHNEELKEMAGSAEAVEPTEVETPNETMTDGTDDEKTLETEKVEEMESMTSPDPETLTPPDNISNSKESTSDLDKDCTLSGDNCNTEPISTNGDGNHTVSEITDQVEDEVESTDDMKCECVAINSGDSLKTSSKDNTEADACPIIGDSESESMSKSESKDNTSVPLPPLADTTDGFKSSSDSEPPAVVNSSSDNSLIEVPSKEPTEAAEAITDDGGAKTETEPECLPPIDVSPSEGGDDSELEQARPESEELNEDMREPKGAVEPDGSLDDEKRESDGEAFDTEEAVVQDEQVDDAENKTLERMDQTDTSNAEVPLKTGDTDAVLDQSSSPTEGTEIGSSTEQDRALVEDTEHKNSQDEESESSCCPLAEELCESSQDKCDNTDSSQPAEVNSDVEDGEDEEGQSFDFDDMDVEAAIVSSLPDNSEQEEIEEAVEVLSDESNFGSSGLCQSNTESNENTQDKPAESSNEEEKESNMPQENSVTNEEATSEKGGNVSEDQKNAPKEEMGATDEQTPITENVKVLNVGELNAVPENINQASSLLEEGSEAIKHEVQGEGLDLPKSAGQDSSKEALQSGRDGKKSSKKSKGKSKEECKMS